MQAAREVSELIWKLTFLSEGSVEDIYLGDA